MKVLILSTVGFGHGSMAPFKYYSAELKERFGLSSTEIVSDCLQQKLRDIKNFDGDLIFVSVPWDFGRFGVVDFLKEAALHKKRAKLVFFDYGDGNESRLWDAVPYVDLYLKQYLHRDMKKYQQVFIGASEFIEYQVKNGFVENSIEEEIWTNLFQAHLAPSDYHKVLVGWNFGLWKRLLMVADGSASKVLWRKDKLHKRLATLVRRSGDIIKEKVTGNIRPIDVYCRAGLYAGWTKIHRVQTIDTLNELPGEYNIVSSTKRVGFSEYYREMENSKIFVCPTGWCEYTPKDYEAMMMGAMLIKPSVEHISTEPDVLVANETYVPVKWDMSDLNQKCIYYLENPRERERIVNNARKAISGYYADQKFLDKLEEILIKLDILPTTQVEKEQTQLRACG
jgi:glycosyltransferase involved in cell wall biosynthesis